MGLQRIGAGLLLTAALAFIGASPAAAQDATRVSREREALRRTQQALKESEAKAEALLREKEAWARDKAGLEAALQQARAEAAGTQGGLRTERNRSAQLLAQADAAASAVKQWKQALQTSDAKVAELAGKLAQTQTALDERSRTLANVTGLLERSTQKNAVAEEKNRKLVALGRDLIEQVRRRTGTEPVLGLGRVELENWAEGARDQVDAERLR